MKKKTAYICSAAFSLDLCPENGGRIDIYATKEAAMRRLKCLGETKGHCSLLKVEIREVKGEKK